jgi:hypothetical protein
MSHLKPEKLFVTYVLGATAIGPVSPRRYTLTHSDFTSDLYLSVDLDYDRKALLGLYTKLMRDEVLA